MPAVRRTSGARDREDAVLSLLRESAAFIAGVAVESCRGGYLDRESCAWYHGIWQYLRVLGVVSSPAWHREFYDKALRQAIEGVQSLKPRVLVSGTADFSMLEQVLHAAREAQRQVPGLDVRVIDRCPTPLASCHWFARRVNAAITVQEVDIFDRFRLTGPFDVITSDAFLTRFERGECVDVIAAWWELLGMNGVVVTTVRLHSELDALRHAEKDVEGFLERVRQRAELHQPGLIHDVTELLKGAEVYARRMRSANLGSEDDMVDLFTGNGFEVLGYERARVAGELFPCDYLRIVARKRRTISARV